MSRKHFEALAQAVKNATAYAELTASQAETVALEIAGACAQSNDRFDRARFLRACGIED